MQCVVSFFVFFFFPPWIATKKHNNILNVTVTELDITSRLLPSVWQVSSSLPRNATHLWLDQITACCPDSFALCNFFFWVSKSKIFVYFTRQASFVIIIFVSLFSNKVSIAEVQGLVHVLKSKVQGKQSYRNRGVGHFLFQIHHQQGQT